MRTSFLAIQLLVSSSFSWAFTTTSTFVPRNRIATGGVSAVVSQRKTVLYSQWDEEDEATSTTSTPGQRTSFDDAGDVLRKEDDDSLLNAMDDFDNNPLYNVGDVSRVRDAVRARTNALGIEQASQDGIKMLEERAKQRAANAASGRDDFLNLESSGGGGAGAAPSGGGDDIGMDQTELDLTRISMSLPRSKQDEDTPSMFYEPETEMTEEEMLEADPDGQKPIPDQVMKELSGSKFPTAFAAAREIVLLFAIGAISILVIVQFDNFLRTFYTDLGMIPRPEDIMSGSEDMILPDGWTDGMSEQDFLQFQDEVAGKAADAASSGFPDL